MGCAQSFDQGAEESNRPRVHPSTDAKSSHIQSIHFNLNQSNNGESANQSQNDQDSLIQKIAFVNAQRQHAEELLRNGQNNQFQNASSHQVASPTHVSNHSSTTSSRQSINQSINQSAIAEIERAKQDLARAQIFNQQNRIQTSVPIQLRPVTPSGLKIETNHQVQHTQSINQSMNQSIHQSMNRPNSPLSQSYSQSISLGPIKNKDSLLYNSGLSSIVKQKRSPPLSPNSQAPFGQSINQPINQSNYSRNAPSMRWEITDQLLGKGRFASVFLGYDREYDMLQSQSLNQPNQSINQSINRRSVAVKVIDKREFHRNRQMVDSELAILRKMGVHDYIVSLIDCFEDALHFYFVMEFASGGDLFSAIVERGRFSEYDASRACQQIALALQYIHSCGITHRDLKPENVLLVNSDSSNNQSGSTQSINQSIDLHVKLADFGLSKLMAHTDTVMATVCGTWAYCAPEVIKHQAYTRTVDLWTLGVLMYILLCGYHPFDAYGDLPEPELLAKICDCEYDFDDPAWANVSQEAKQLIMQLLQQDPTKRISLEDFLKSQWIQHSTQLYNQSIDDTRMPTRLKHTLGQAFKAIVHAKLAITRFRASISRSRNAGESRSKGNLTTINHSTEHSPRPSHNSLHTTLSINHSITQSRKASIVSMIPQRISPQETFMGDQEELETIEAL